MNYDIVFEICSGPYISIPTFRVRKHDLENPKARNFNKGLNMFFRKSCVISELHS